MKAVSTLLVLLAAAVATAGESPTPPVGKTIDDFTFATTVGPNGRSANWPTRRPSSSPSSAPAALAKVRPALRRPGQGVRGQGRRLRRRRHEPTNAAPEHHPPGEGRRDRVPRPQGSEQRRGRPARCRRVPETLSSTRIASSATTGGSTTSTVSWLHPAEADPPRPSSPPSTNCWKASRGQRRLDAVEGCFVGRVHKATTAAAEVTYSKHIRRSCRSVVECHGPAKSRRSA